MGSNIPIGVPSIEGTNSLPIDKSLFKLLEKVTLKPSGDDVLDEFVQSTKASSIDKALLERFEKATGHVPHRYLRRGIVFCHRDLEHILDKYERGETFYLFTGRGPSSESLHIGHSIPFEFTKWLQDVFHAPLIIMLTDDMKLLHSDGLNVKDVKRYALGNAKDILAFGFKPESTFMFSNLDYVGGAFYENIIAVARRIQIKDIKTALGFNDSDNVGMFYSCSTQSAGAFATSFPGILGKNLEKLQSMSCMIACSYDIDGYFSEVRKHAENLGYTSPAFLYSSLLPALHGAHVKMSASIMESSIYLTDSVAEIQKKFSPDVLDMDIAVMFQYLCFFMEDDVEFENILRQYHDKEVSIEQLILVLTKVVQDQVARFQENRLKVTDEYLQSVMERRLLE